MWKAIIGLWAASATMAQDLLPMQFFREVHTAAYELPELAGRAELQDALEGSLKRSFPQADVINVAGLPDATRQDSSLRKTAITFLTGSPAISTM
jgi:hypothetical protein